MKKNFHAMKFKLQLKLDDEKDFGALLLAFTESNRERKIFHDHF